MENLRKFATILLFFALMFGLLVWHIALPDETISLSERRPLEQIPAFSAASVLSGEYMEDLGAYLLDQFPLRDQLRALKTTIQTRIFHQKDSNGFFLAGEQICKLEDPLDERQIQYTAEKINAITDRYLADSAIYYAVVPDKNAYTAEEYGYPHLDYDRMLELLQDTITTATYIDLFPLLSAEDYYDTDTHWRQEAIPDVAQALADAMAPGLSLTPADGWTQTSYAPFYGVYYGQSMLKSEADTLIWLTSPAISAATMTGSELKGVCPVYTTERLTGKDAYDIFAAGAQSILYLESPLAASDRELILFRDSFGSSLAPLLLEGYSHITLIDLRYITSDLLEQYVDFHGQDVLFLYSTGLINSGYLLK